MGKPKNTPSSYAPLLIAISFNTSPPTTLRSMDFLQQIELELLGDGAWKASITLFDSQGDTLEGLAFVNNEDQQITFSFGWDNSSAPQIPSWTGQIIKYTPTFTPEGTQLHLEVVATSALAAAMQKEPIAFDAGMTATEIFQFIAERNAWQITDEDGTFTFEDSQGSLDSFPYRGESDVEFIQQRLLPQSVNSKGEAFMFFLKGNIAHFHSYKFKPGGNQFPLAADYVFLNSNMGEVIEFSPTDNVIEAYLLGGGNSEFTSANSPGGEASQVSADATTGLAAQQGANGSKLTVVADAAAKRVPYPDATHAKVYIVSRTIEELQRKAAAHWSTLSNFTYSATLIVRGTHAVYPFDRVRVVRLMKNGKPHYMSGVFMVINLHQALDTGGWRTTMALIREGTGVTGDNADSQLISATERDVGTVNANTQTASPTTSPTVPTGVTYNTVPVRTP